jgi:hypothetical protein
MFRQLRLLPILVVLLAGSGCNDSNPGTSSLRVLHASPDAPKVNVLINKAAVLEDVDYKQGSGFLTKPAGTYDVAVQGGACR